MKGYHPSLDITPVHLASGVVTDRGMLSPYDLARYHAEGNTGGYELVVWM